MSCCGQTVQRIAHGASALLKAAAGLGYAPGEVVRARRDICRACEHASRRADWAHRPSAGLTNLSRCARCGCFIAPKTLLAAESCPDGRWAALTDPVQRNG